MSPVTFLPLRWIAMAACIAAAAGTGYVFGLRHEADRHAAFVAQVASAGAAQAERTRATIARRADVTQQSEIHHVQAAADLRRLHGPGRVREPAHFGGVKLPAISNPAGQSDGPAADPGPGAALPAPADTCVALRSDAAVTTSQLLDLQAWVWQQAAIQN